MNSLPTPEQILSLLKREGSMVGSRMRGILGITKKSKIAFKQLLAEMQQEGFLDRDDKKQYVPANPRRKANPDAPEDKKPARDERRPAARSRRQKTGAEDSSPPRLLRGILLKKSNEWFVQDPTTHISYRIAQKRRAPGVAGQTIAYSLYPHPRHGQEMLAKPEVSNADITFTELAKEFLRANKLSHRFPAEVETQIKDLERPDATQSQDRMDLRNLQVLCIDPIGARDHDDAISIVQNKKGGWQLGVHIADVSWYVSEGSPLDREACDRAFTQYLPWTAVPMLPEKLSADLCSLVEGEDRFAFSCLMNISDKGEVQDWTFARSVICVTRGITYEQAMDLLEQNDGEVVKLAELTRILRERRFKSGSLELNSPEYQVQFNEQGEPVGLQPRSSVESNFWVEECMLAANRCCARELVKRKLQGIYRTHEPPTAEDIQELYTNEPTLFQGAPVTLKEATRPREPGVNVHATLFKLYKHLVSKAQGDDSKIYRILRSMQKAHYSAEPCGHFALNWQDYSHFTSPIRRYADLWVHRELARSGRQIKAKRWSVVADVCDLISGREIVIQKTERQALKLCGVYLLKDRVGETFAATVNGIEEWGVFVSLSDPQAEGMVRYRDLPGNEYYMFHPEKKMLVGKKSGRTLVRGDAVEVQLLGVNLIKAEADFAILKILK